jgi:DNA-binding Lrp family transcriptional regulator
MPLKLDSVDAAILQALSVDGRKSLRQLSREINISAPTVDARLKRIMQSGLISRIAPIYNMDKLDEIVNILLWLKVEGPKLSATASELAKLEEVKGIFITTGEGNLLVKISDTDYDNIQHIISDKIGATDGVNVLSTQMITKTLKDEQGVAIKPTTKVSLRCDYCKEMIGGDVVTLKIMDGERFFCCKTCLSTYKEKYKAKIQI